MTPFQITPVSSDLRAALLGGVRTLHGNKVRTVRADAHPGYPCRVSLEDAVPGEEVFLLSHVPFAGQGPYREMGPIFVRVEAAPAALGPNELPPIVRARQVVVRGYDHDEQMIRADMAEGDAVAAAIGDCLADEAVAFVHLRAAVSGCFLCRADRIEAARTILGDAS